MSFPFDIPTADDAGAALDKYGYLLLMLGMVVVAGVALGTLIAAHRKDKSPTSREAHKVKWFIGITTLAVQAFSLEGMWEVVVDNLGIDPWLAACVFFGLEAAIVVFCAFAAENYADSAVFDDDGNLVTPGNPGWQGGMVWGLAAFVGLVVMINSLVFADSFWKGLVEGVLRASLPILAAALWWSRSIRHGVTKKKTTWRWTPERLLVRIGAKEPGEADLNAAPRRYLVRQMVINAARVHSTGRLSGFGEKRLRKLARDADDSVITEVAEQVARVQRIKDLTDPAKIASFETKIRDAETQLATDRAAHAAVLAELEEKHTVELAELQRQSDAAVEALRAEMAEQVAALQAQADEGMEAQRRQVTEAFAKLKGERDELAEKLRQVEEASTEQVRELNAEVARLRPLAEAATAAAPRVNGSRPAPANGSTSGSAERVPVQPNAANREPVASPSAHATAGSAALAPQPLPEALVVPEAGLPTGDARAALHAAWNELVESGAITGEESTTVLVERGTKHLGIEVKLRTAQKYASDWKKDPFRARPAPQPEPSDPRRGLYSVPNQ